MADLILNLASLKAKCDAAGATTSATNTTPSLCPNKSSITGYVTDGANRVVISGSYSDNQLVKDSDVKIKSTGRVTSAPTNKNSEWTGGSLSLINAGSGTGTMYYSLNGGSYSTSIPVASAVGSYTIYYYAASNSDYVQSSVSSITATISHPKNNGHEYVDLGLPSGTKWATMNIGASSETGYGNLYMFGMGTRTYHVGDSYYLEGGDPIPSSVDTATQTWGGNWHTPRLTQIEELFNNTSYSWVTINGINGMKFTAGNGNYIFLPATGRYDGDNAATTIDRRGTYGYYYSSTSWERNSYAAYYCTVTSGKAPYTNKDYGNYGRAIRGVIG